MDTGTTDITEMTNNDDLAPTEAPPSLEEEVQNLVSGTSGPKFHRFGQPKTATITSTDESKKDERVPGPSSTPAPSSDSADSVDKLVEGFESCVLERPIYLSVREKQIHGALARFKLLANEDGPDVIDNLDLPPKEDEEDLEVGEGLFDDV